MTSDIQEAEVGGFLESRGLRLVWTICEMMSQKQENGKKNNNVLL